jgi:hypothetical protein
MMVLEVCFPSFVPSTSTAIASDEIPSCLCL